MNRFVKALSLSALCLSFAVVPALAQSAYPSALASDFTNWCTAKQGQPATVCTCALEQSMVQIPAASMASYLAAPAGAASATVAAGVGATAVQIITTCAAGASPAAGAAIGAAATMGSGLFGK